MPRVAPVITNFNAGEWSPRLYGRVDLQRYPNAARELRNVLPLVEGAVTKRPGTRFVAQTKSNRAARLLGFEFNTEQTYILEFTDLAVRIYRAKARVESPPGTPVEIVTPWPEATLFELGFVQSADTLYVVHPDYAPRKITRSSDTSWSIATVDWRDGPYLDENTTTTTLTPAATTGTGIALTASAVTGINGGAGFSAADVGRLVRVKHAGTTWGWAKIASYVSTTQVTIDIQQAFGAATASASWRLGAWGSTRGWPRAITFHEERLWLASSKGQLQTLWSSVTGDFENLAPTSYGPSPAAATLADNGITYALADDRVNAVLWLNSGDVLTAGTRGGEFIVRASNLNEAITPDNVTARRGSTRGSAAVQPVRIDDAVLYVHRNRRSVLQLAYDVQRDSYGSSDVTRLARHLVRGQVRQLAWQAEPWACVWAAMEDGTLAAMTYLREQDVIGWHRHQLGGSAVKVLSVASITTATESELWLVVERAINGSTVRYVEVLETEFYAAASADLADAWYVDSALAYSGAATTTLSGLTHLIGQTVAILANGAVHPPRVVSAGGSVTLDNAATKAVVGLPFTARIESMNLEAGAADGTAQGKRQRVHRIVLRLFQTVGCEIGWPGGSLDEIPWRAPADPMGSPPALFSGDKRVAPPFDWDDSARIVVQSQLPTPMTVVALMPRLVTNDG